MLPIWDTIKHAVLATATKIATMSLFWLEQMLPFCPKDIPDVDHKCCKKSRQKITFFHGIFMRKFSTPLHWSCCLLLSNIVKIDLISSSHFFGHRCQNWFFTLFCGFFCSHVKTPLKISAIIFHFPSIMKVVIDHFPKVFSGQLHKVKMNKSILLYDKSVSSLFVCPRISSEPWTTCHHETLHA